MVATAVVFVCFGLVSLAVLGPALHGGFVADDLGYVLNNAYIHDLDLESVVGILEPGGAPALFTANYAPVHLFAHALEWQAFGARTFGYHVVNVVAHATVALLLVVDFRRSGIQYPFAAVLLAGLFLLHPANVEAVVWVFQLKTLLALGLSLVALAAFPRWPLLATVVFGLAVLSKFSAVCVLPFAAIRVWVRRESSPRVWGTLALWAGMVLLVAVPQFAAFDRIGNAEALRPYSGPIDQFRSMVAILGRYAGMALTGYGLSAFHEPPKPVSWADGWFLLGAGVAIVLATRFLTTVRRRSEEAAYWVFAAGAYAPVSQVFPFVYPVADRYLYFVLPGLLGATFLWAGGVLSTIERAWGPRPARCLIAAAVASASVLLVAFAWTSHDRARLWRSPTLLTGEAARNYPEGRSALFLRAERAARRGDDDEALAALEELAGRGFAAFSALEGSPALGTLRRSDRYRAVLHRVAGTWLGHSRRDRWIQPERRVAAHAHLARGEVDDARRALEQALELGGPFDPAIRAELESLP